eukprot:TRINITY_DN990_c0_g1_i2.p1 TRINITY_DN990_c0_g1~~TRINITY_DN990_c0_g1_i2.p1  ORF type:complete len:849 (+),score=141.51 TRINITY_DN990_c0_g1_i2:2065-4611(+)
MLKPVTLLTVVAVSLLPSALSQPCENGAKVDGKSCCDCEAGFAPPDCSKCLDGYMLGVDASGKKICYNGVTNCHNDLPAPFGCNGRGTCIPCSSTNGTACKPTCECKSGFYGPKCEQSLSSGCQPDSIHMYTVFPQQPISGENFSIQLWGCNIAGMSSFRILPSDMPCDTPIDQFYCGGSAEGPVIINYNTSETAASSACTSCGECVDSSGRWTLAKEKCEGTPAMESTELSLAKCLSACYDSAECQNVEFECKTGLCRQFKDCQPGQPTSTDTTRWVLKRLAVVSAPQVYQPVSASGVVCSGPDSSNCRLVTYNEADEYCRGEGLRLCSLEELDSDICCGAEGCNDHSAIWTSDYTSTCPPMAQSMNGCPPQGEVKDLQTCESAERKLSVACCSTTGRCYGTKKDQSGCYGSASTFSEATQICQADGMRLCKATEVAAGACCGQGCGTSDGNIWVATEASDASNKCTDGQIAGETLPIPASQGTACSSKGSQQCADKGTGLGGIRCCGQIPKSSGAGDSTTDCPKSAVEISSSVVQNKATGCFQMRNRDVSTTGGDQTVSVRLVAPLNGLCTDDSCGCSNHVSCSDPSNCPSCKAAIELCNTPGSFLQLQGNLISFNPPPENFCDTHMTEDACVANTKCFWSTVCQQQSVIDFFAETEFSLHPSQHEGFSTIQKDGMEVVRGSGGSLLSVSTSGSGMGSWLFEAAVAQSSTEASIPTVLVNVPTGTADYKVCHRPTYGTAWIELQTHTLEGYRTSFFTISDSKYISGAADGDGAATDDCDSPLALFIILLLLCLFLVILLAVCSARKLRNDAESERNNKKYSDFDADDDEFDCLPLDTTNKDLEPEC